MQYILNPKAARLYLHVQLEHGQNARVDFHMEAAAEGIAQPINARLAAILELLKVRGT